MVRRPAVRRRGAPGSGRRRPNRPLVLEALESRWCPTLTLARAGIDEGLNLSNFAYNVPTADGTTETIGAYALAFPSNGTVLGSDEPGNARIYPGDFDGQNAVLDAPVRKNYGFANAKGLAQLGDNIYMVGYFSASVSQLNTDGTLNHVIVYDPNNLYSAEDVVADPARGHLYVSTQQHGLWDVDPNTGVKRQIVAGGFCGLALSADGTTLYAGHGDPGDQLTDGRVLGFDTTTRAQVWDSGPMEPVQRFCYSSPALGSGSFAGNLYVSMFDGQVFEVNIADPTQQHPLIADQGPHSGGTFITVDPNDGSFLIGEADRIERLTFPSGGGGSGGGAAPIAPLGHQQLPVALAEADSLLSHSPANKLPPPQLVGEPTPLPREHSALAGSIAGPQPGFPGRYVLDSLFAAHPKGSHPMSPADLDPLALGLIGGPN
jgi:hypothetical protein